MKSHSKYEGKQKRIEISMKTKIEHITKLKVNLPNYSKQNLFGERVSSIERQKVQAEASLVQAENLFNSLLQRAFKGELV